MISILRSAQLIIFIMLLDGVFFNKLVLCHGEMNKYVSITQM